MTSFPRALDLNLLPVFDALMRHRSVTLAAREVGLTQASASNALDRLRQALDDRVLERQGNRMAPTRLALELWPAVSEALGQLTAGLEAVRTFAPPTSHHRFRVGMDDYALSTLGAELAAHLAVDAPGTSLELFPATHPDEQAQLRQGAFDVYCGAVWEAPSGLADQLLWQEEFVGLASPHLGLGPCPLLTEVLTHPHVLVSIRGAVTGNVDVALASVGQTRRVAASLPSFDAAARLCARTNYLFFCGTRLARRFEHLYGLSRFEPPLPIPGFSVKLLWNRRDSRSPAHTWLRRQMAELTAG